jgi:hypothetical protein
VHGHVLSDRHRCRIEEERVPSEPDQIAPEHQRTAGRQGEIVDSERELQIGRAALIEHQRG